MKSLASALKATMSGQRCALGMFMKTSDPAFVEIAGLAGLDFVILDMEHGPVGYERMQDLIRAAEIRGLAPVIRTSDHSPAAISKALDVGACGVQVPKVSSAAEARAVIRAAKFHPGGSRGVCRFVRAAGYSCTPRDAYCRDANETLAIVQLEGIEALRNIEEILDVDDVDVVFVGPYDLSQSFGRPGEIHHPEIVSAMGRIVDAAVARGKIVGTFVDSLDAMQTWVRAGVRYVAYSVDMGVFADACGSLRSSFDALQRSL